MTEKLNRIHIYGSAAYLTKSNTYSLWRRSHRSSCSRCKYSSSCPYSYIIVYFNKDGNCIKCLRFTPIREAGESFDRDVGLYTPDETYYVYDYFRSGRSYGRKIK